MLSKEQLKKRISEIRKIAGELKWLSVEHSQIALSNAEALEELLSLREQQPVSFEWRQHYSSIGKSGPWVKLNDQRTYEKLKSKHAGDADYGFRELFTEAKLATTEVPEGYKLVPIKLTPKMRMQMHTLGDVTCYECGTRLSYDCTENVEYSWEDILEASPEAPNAK